MLILASASPRRQELLQLITRDFSVMISETDETLPAGIPPEDAVKMLARQKAEAVYRKYPLDLVIGADTLVACDGRILGKPSDAEEAKAMLRRLSGRSHSVFTGVCVMSAGECELFAEESIVSFYPLSEQEIERYVATGEPMDKAGAYGIQEKGALLVSRIEGDFYTIMGLPVARLYRVLRKLGRTPSPTQGI